MQKLLILYFFLTLAVVINSIQISKACKYLYDKTCTSDLDCCSGNCFLNNRQWGTGICEPSRNVIKFKDCTALYTSCQRNSECCTKFCDRKSEFFLGFCNIIQPQAMSLRCKALDDNTCTSNSQCCSGFCDNNHTCRLKVTEIVALPATRCMKLYANKCTNDEQCCSGFCDRNSGTLALGVCKLIGSVTVPNCKVEYDNTCSENWQCCSEFCFKNPIGKWALGVCRNSSCKRYGDNTCVRNSDCCSGFCDNKNGSWAHGVCY